MNQNITVLDTFKLSTSGIHNKSYHMNRTIDCLKLLKSSIPTDDVIKFYESFENSHENYKIRIEIDPKDWSKINIQKSRIETSPQFILLEISHHKNQIAGTGLQNYKTNQREYWEENLKFISAKADDIIGVNTQGYVTETSRFNLFLEKDGQMFTPSLKSGCLNGCLRQSLLHKLIEQDILLGDLSKYKIYVGNSLRGLIPAAIID